MGGKQVPSIDYFERETTQRNDYRWPKNVKRELGSHSVKEKEITKFKDPSLIKYMDVESLVPYVSGSNVPFTLQLHRKPILQTNPREHINFKIIQELPKNDDNIRFTRPRVYKAPEISLDDIPEKETRDMIIDYTYKSTWNNDCNDAAGNITHRNIPSTTWQSPFDDVVSFKEKIVSSPFEEDWGRKCGKAWNKLQTCFTIDPDQKFWQEYKKKKPEVVVEHEIFDHIIKLEEGKLRMPYRIPKFGYTGFTPSAPFNIKPEKNKLKPTDCQLSLNEAVERWKFENKC